MFPNYFAHPITKSFTKSKSAFSRRCLQTREICGLRNFHVCFSLLFRTLALRLWRKYAIRALTRDFSIRVSMIIYVAALATKNCATFCNHCRSSNYCCAAIVISAAVHWKLVSNCTQLSRTEWDRADFNKAMWWWAIDLPLITNEKRIEVWHFAKPSLTPTLQLRDINAHFRFLSVDNSHRFSSSRNSRSWHFATRRDG